MRRKDRYRAIPDQYEHVVIRRDEVIKANDKVWVVFEPNELTELSEGNVVEATVFKVEETKTITAGGVGIERRYTVDFGLERTSKHEGSIFSYDEKHDAIIEAKARIKRQERRLKNKLEALQQCNEALGA